MSAHCYSRRFLATREQQQEQRNCLDGDQDPRLGSQRGLRKLCLTPQNPCEADNTSEISSMESELDEADTEVKHLTDLAFKSLSTPPVDYLDVCDSSCRSSADASQISAEENSAASAWSAYAELRGSVQLESDDSLSQPRLADGHDDDDTESFGVGGFECVDVVLESEEEVRGGVGPKMVPKRQIQLRRCSTNEFQASTSPPRHGQPKGVYLRQHSTPAMVQEGSCRSGPESSPDNRKQRLQKSLSLDETSSKTKMASSLIKNVLSKKMQFERKIQQQQPQEGNFSLSQFSPFRETPKSKVSSMPLCTSVPLGHSWSPEGLPCQVEPDLQSSSVQQHRSINANTHQKPFSKNSFAIQSVGGRPAKSHSNDAGRKGLKHETPTLSGSEKLNPREWGKQLPGDRENHSDDSAKASTRSECTTRKTSKAKEECQVMPRGHLPPEPPEIALAPHAKEEKREITTCSPPNFEIKATAEALVSLPDKVLAGKEMQAGRGEAKRLEEMGNKEYSERGQMIAPLHRVRDMRKLVKSTYNLSFNFNSTSTPGHRHIFQEQDELFPVLRWDGAIYTKEDKVGAGWSGERHPGKKAQAPPCMSAWAPLERVGKMASLYIAPSHRVIEGGALPSSHDMKPSARSTEVNAYSVSELGTRVVTVQHDIQKPQVKVTSANKQAVTAHTLHVSAAAPPALPHPEPLSYQAASFNGKNSGPSQTPALLRSLHHPPVPPACPTPQLQPHPKDTRQLLQEQPRDGHRAPCRTPPQTPELTEGDLDEGQSCSPHMPPPEVRKAYPCGLQRLPAMFTTELGGEMTGGGRALYPPGGDNLASGQNSRRLLLDPETGTCFYVNMPAQPQLKVLFDPESGQYLEVLVPPRPPPPYPTSVTSCPYPYLPSQGIYTPQYLPYSILSLPQAP